MLNTTASLSRLFQSRDCCYMDLSNWLNLRLHELEVRFTYYSVKEASRCPPKLSPNIRSLLSKLKTNKGKFHGHQLHPAKDQKGDVVPWENFEKTAFWFKTFFNKTVATLVANIRERFPAASMGVASSFKCLDPNVMAQLEEDQILAWVEAAKADIRVLGQHFGVGRGGVDPWFDVDELEEQFDIVGPILVRFAVQYRNNELQAAAAKAKGKGTGAGGAAAGPSTGGAVAQPGIIPTRRFWKGIIPTLQTGECTALLQLVYIMLVVQPSTADVERGFSAMNLIKTDGRNLLSLETLDLLLCISLNGPDIDVRPHAPGTTPKPPFEVFDRTILPEAVTAWHKAAEHGRCPQRSSKAQRPRAGNGQAATMEEDVAAAMADVPASKDAARAEGVDAEGPGAGAKGQCAGGQGRGAGGRGRGAGGRGRGAGGRGRGAGGQGRGAGGQGRGSSGQGAQASAGVKRGNIQSFMPPVPKRGRR